MKTFEIRRNHALGLDSARRLGQKWADRAFEKLGLECETESADDHDLIRFRRSGVDGHLRVAADRVEVVANLGGFVAPMADMLQARFADQIDRMLERARTDGG